MDRLFCMQVFVRVVDHGAFAKAAAALGISRASATEAVAQLERRLGVRLLNRTTRRVSLTDEGRSYYANCVRILGDVTEAEDDLLARRKTPRGRLRVSVPQSFVNAVFFPALTRFTRTYPELEIEIHLTDRAVNLVEEGIDCALRGMEIPPDSGLVARTMCVSNWLTCASPAYLAEHGVPETVEDLAMHNCIRFVSQSTGRPRDWLFNDDGRQRVVVPQGNVRLTSFDAAIELAISGCGVVQVPDILGYGAVLSRQLQPVLTGHVTSAPSLVLVYPGNRYLTAKVRAFVDFMAAAFPKEGWWQQVVSGSADGVPDALTSGYSERRIQSTGLQPFPDRVAE